MSTYVPLVLKVGDVITSPRFAFSCGPETNHITPVGAEPTKAFQANSSRRKAKYVIIDTQIREGGSDQSGPYPDSITITAKRLDQDGKFNPDGETISFLTAGLRNDEIPQEEIVISGHMEQYFR